MIRQKKIFFGLSLNFESERVRTVRDAPNSMMLRSIQRSTWEAANPIQEVETNLQVLRRAGINPQQVPSQILQPSDPYTLQQMGMSAAMDLAENTINENNTQKNE